MILNDVLRESTDFASSLTREDIGVWNAYFADPNAFKDRSDSRIRSLFQKFPVFVGTTYRGAQGRGISEFFRMDESEPFGEQMENLTGQTFTVPHFLSTAQSEYAAEYHGYKRATGRAYDQPYASDWEPRTHSFLLQFNNAVGADVDKAFRSLRKSGRGGVRHLLDMWETYGEDDGKEVILYPNQTYAVVSFSVDDEKVEYGTRRVPTGNRVFFKHRKEPITWPHSRIRVVLERR